MRTQKLGTCGGVVQKIFQVISRTFVLSLNEMRYLVRNFQEESLWREHPVYTEIMYTRTPGGSTTTSVLSVYCT